MPTISTPTDGGSNYGYSFAVSFATLTVTSAATVTSDAASGVISSYANDTVANSGMISGADGGIFGNASSFQVINYRTGTINGQITGVAVAGINESVSNYGYISVPLSAGSHFGMFARDGSGATYSLTAINSGVIQGYVGNYIVSGSSEVISNSGEIDGVFAAISSRGATFGFTDGGILAIHNDGTIRGDVLFGPAGGTFDGNGGIIDGNISGGSGNEIFDLSHQTVNGTIAGGGGYDVIGFSNASGGFAIDLGQGTASGAGEAFDFSGIENAVGSHYGDTILGDANDNIIAAGSGNDVVAGAGGNDTIDGGAGNDALDGGSGVNTVAYVSAASGVTVNLGAQGAAQATGGSGSDTLSNFQNLTGSAYNDSLVGDGNANVIHGGGGNDLIAGANGNNVLYGDAGNDTIAGGTGNDRIEGDAGRDTLTGGAGADTFVYKLASDSTVAAPDLITDFTSGSDKIDISALHTSGSDTFAITSSGGYTYVAVDQKGDGTIDTLIKLTGTNIVAGSDVIWGTAPAAAVHTAIAPAHTGNPHLAHQTVSFPDGAHHASVMDHGIYG